MAQIRYAKIQYGALKSGFAEMIGVEWWLPVIQMPDGRNITFSDGFPTYDEACGLAHEMLKEWAANNDVVLEDPNVFN